LLHIPETAAVVVQETFGVPKVLRPGMLSLHRIMNAERIRGLSTPPRQRPRSPTIFGHLSWRKVRMGGAGL
jgi:hypothetical protein